MPQTREQRNESKSRAYYRDRRRRVDSLCEQAQRIFDEAQEHLHTHKWVSQTLNKQVYQNLLRQSKNFTYDDAATVEGYIKCLRRQRDKQLVWTHIHPETFRRVLAHNNPDLEGLHHQINTDRSDHAFQIRIRIRPGGSITKLLLVPADEEKRAQDIIAGILTNGEWLSNQVNNHY